MQQNYANKMASFALNLRKKGKPSWTFLFALSMILFLVDLH